MLVACIHGKVGRDVYEIEDVLTSNVFSFFKYAERKTFLKNMLMLNDLLSKSEIEALSDDDLEDAEFIFWPSFHSAAFNDIHIEGECEKGIAGKKKRNEVLSKSVRTEPDLILKVRGHYIVFEAKLDSDFHSETEEKESQLVREFKGGEIEAKKIGYKFTLVTVTKHYHYSRDVIYEKADADDYLDKIKWINWQGITRIVDDCLEYNTLRKEDREFGYDLRKLLYKLNLRFFYGWGFVNNLQMEFDGTNYIFYKMLERTKKINADIPINTGGTCDDKGKTDIIEQSEKQNILLEDFWTSLLDSANTRTKLHLNSTISGRSCVTARVRKFLEFNYLVFSRSEHGARVELYINSGDKTKNKAIFDFLEESKQRVEELFGGELKWERMDDKNACRVSKALNTGNYKDKSTWLELQHEMIDAMVRLEHALMPLINAFESL